MKDIDDIKILVIEDDQNLHITLKNYGADYVMDSETAYQKVGSGWDDFDIVIIRPEMMSKVGRFSKLLGPRGKMPSPKCGTVVSENKLLLAIKTVKSISAESKPNNDFKECQYYVKQKSFCKIREFLFLPEYEPIAKYLRQEIVSMIINNKTERLL